MTKRPQYKSTERYGIKSTLPMNIRTILPERPPSNALKVLKTVVLWAVLLGGLLGLSVIADRLIGADAAQPIMFLVGMCVGSFGMVTTQAIWSEW